MSASRIRYFTPNNTTPVIIKINGANVMGYNLINAAVTLRFAKFFNQTNTPVVGTDVPFVTVQVPASGSVDVARIDGIAFGQSAWVTVTTGIADADNTAPAANDVLVQVFYQ